MDVNSDKGVKIAKPGNEETSTSEGFEILANILDFIRHDCEAVNWKTLCDPSGFCPQNELSP